MNYLILENINVQKSSRNAFCFVPAAFHFPSLVHCFPIRFLIHRFAPFRMGILSRNADCQVGEPAVCCCTVPVFDACRDVDDISCGHADGFFSFFLIESSSCHTDQASFILRNFSIFRSKTYSASDDKSERNE